MSKTCRKPLIRQPGVRTLLWPYRDCAGSDERLGQVDISQQQGSGCKNPCCLQQMICRGLSCPMVYIKTLAPGRRRAAEGTCRCGPCLVPIPATAGLPTASPGCRLLCAYPRPCLGKQPLCPGKGLRGWGKTGEGGEGGR